MPEQKSLLSPEMVSLDIVRNQLAGLWLTGAGLILVIVVVQSLLGHYGNDAQEALGWLLPTLMPTVSMIATVLTYTALEPKVLDAVVRKAFFNIALYLSGFYLFLILLTIAIQPFAPSGPLQLMRLSNLWLGPVQGVVASALGVLFVSKKNK
jgi:hypothetical protein